MKKKLFLTVSFALNVIIQAQTLQWAKSMGGASANSFGYQTTSDVSGNVYTTGFYSGTVDFDSGAGVFNHTAAGSQDIFISKLNASGNFVWAKCIGGSTTEGGYSLVVDASGYIYVTGSFAGTVDFDPNAGTHTLSAGTGQAVFILKLDSAGNFIFAQSIGASYTAAGTSIAVDASGNIYTTGYFFGTGDFDPGSGTYTLSSQNAGPYTNTFISKLDASGNFAWANVIGGPNSTGRGSGITVDAAGNVYTTGLFSTACDFDPGPGTYTLSPVSGVNSDTDIFISKLSSSGNFVWARNMGGSSSDAGNTIAVDASGNIYTTGSFAGTADFDPGSGIFNLVSAGNSDVVISKLDASGNFVWAKGMGGLGSDRGYSALDAAGNIYTVGSFTGTADFDPSANAFNLTSVGKSDIFISKLDASGNYIWAKSMGGILDDIPYSISTDASGNIYATGYFSGTSDFDPDTSAFNLTAIGTNNVFISKIGTAPNTTGLSHTINISADVLHVYPNPTNGTFKVRSTTNINMCLINDLGQVVKEIDLGEYNNYQLNIEKLAPGIYFLTDENSRKFLKQKIIITQ